MSQLAIIVIVVLMPGILAASVADKLTVHSKWDSFKFPLYALIFGALTYSLLQLLLYGWDIFVYVWSALRAHRPPAVSWTSLAIWSIAQDGNSKIRPVEVVAAVVLAPPVAFIIAACVQHKIITRMGNFLHVTPKYGDENLYTYFLNAKETDWIYVRDKDSNLTYEGRVAAFSENEHAHELVLLDVAVYRYEDSEKLYSVPRIYLCKEIGKLVVETIPEDRLREERSDVNEAVN